ncbi:MAG: FkbM family methyltransferase [Planctomycetota bacterium]|jgi:FkbM family methyltransferase
MKILANFLCCFVPGKRTRKEIKRRLAGTGSRRKRLLAAGCRITNDILTTPEDVKIDVSNVPHEAMGITKEVFLNRNYAVDLGCDAVLIDVGLNRGIASLFFATCPNIKRIYSFEPFRPTFELARKNLGLNPQLAEKITAYNVGLGKAETTRELPYMSKATGGMSTTHDVCRGEKDIEEVTVIIKDAAREISRILEANKNEHMILKCDCEGAEFEIFERLDEENLIGHIDVVLMEYHFDKPDRLVEILAENGFAVHTKVLSEKMGTGDIYAVRMTER